MSGIRDGCEDLRSRLVQLTRPVEMEEQRSLISFLPGRADEETLSPTLAANASLEKLWYPTTRCKHAIVLVLKSDAVGTGRVSGMER